MSVTIRPRLSGFATGQLCRGPGAGASGPKHHDMFDLHALDTMLDVQPAADAFESRANVMKAIQDTFS